MTLNIVDLFCGAGGMTAGLLAAADRLRLRVNFTAVNHWDTAINSHSLNHPGVRHLCEPVENLIPAKVIPSRRLHLLAAGCECTYHSIARGGGPCNEQSRSQPWQLIRWATDIRVDNILMENVKEFLDWGPLHPCTCGAEARWRKRHGPDDPLPVLKHRKGATCHRPIAQRKGEFFHAFVTALRNLGYNVDWRVQCAADFGDPTSRRRFMLMARADGAPITWPNPTHCDPALLATSPRKLKPWRVAREIIDWSLPTTSIFGRKKPLCANTMNRIEAGLKKFGGPDAEPFLVLLRGTSRGHLNNGHSLDTPLTTVSTSGRHHLLVKPEFILPPEGYYRGNTAKSLDQPLPTITASRGRAFQLVQSQLTPMVIGQQSAAAARPVSRPLPTVAGKGAIQLVQPFLYHANHGVDKKARGRTARRVHSLQTPLPTVTSKRGLGLCEPIITHTDHTSTKGPSSRPLGVPLGTIVSKQNMLLVQPLLAKFYGTGACQPITEPLDTVTTRDRFLLVECALTKAGQPKGKRRVLGELDIRTRMLKPHELAKAHSLDGFTFTGTQEDQTKQIGNSVPKKLAEAHAGPLLKSYRP
jgi:DNA (cytosine-5)-methyltransferase 1